MNLAYLKYRIHITYTIDIRDTTSNIHYYDECRMLYDGCRTESVHASSDVIKRVIASFLESERFQTRN